MAKLDLSKFKKVASTAEATILRHPEGHEIKIAHNAVSPNTKKELDALPHLDEGGSVDSPAPKVSPTPKPSPDDYDEETKKMYNHETWQNLSDGGKVDDDSSKKTIGELINFPGSTPSPSPKPNKEYAKGGSVHVAKMPVFNAAKNLPRFSEGGQAMQHGGAKYAKGGNIQDPTQEHLMPGDKIPNSIEKQVVGQAKRLMAEGGDVNSSQMPDQLQQIMQDTGADVPQQSQDIPPELQARRDAYNNMIKTRSNMPGDPDEQQRIAAQQFGPNGEPPANFNSDAWNQASANYEASQTAELAAKKQATMQLEKQNESRVAAGLAPTPLTADQMASVNPPAQDNTQAPSQAAPTSYEGAPEAAIPGDKELQAVQNGQRAVNQAMPSNTPQNAQGSTQQAPQVPSPADTAKNLVAAKQMTYDALLKERQSILESMKNADPLTMGKIFDDKSWHGKIGMLAGLMLGGASSAQLGQQNNVASMYQNMIDNNLKAQQLNMAKQQNLLSNNMQLMGNLPDAIKLSKLQMNDLMMHKLVQLAQKYPNNPTIQQNLQAMGMLGMQSSNNIMDTLAANQAWRHAVDHIQDPAQKIQFNPLMTPEQKNEALKQLGTYQGMNNARNNLLNAFDQVSNMSLAGKFSPNQRDALLEPLLAQAVKDSEGRITPQDVPMIKALLPAASDAGKQTRALKRSQLAKFMSAKMNFPMLNLAGINTQTPPIGNIQAGPPKLGK